jgi:hypothetical protein
MTEGDLEDTFPAAGNFPALLETFQHCWMLESSIVDRRRRRRPSTSIVDIVDPPASLEDSTGPYKRSL